jgi:hypothetical protein
MAGGTKRSQKRANPTSASKRAKQDDYSDNDLGETQDDLDSLISSYEIQMKKRAAKRRLQEPDFRTLLASRIEESSKARSALFSRLSDSRHSPEAVSRGFEKSTARWFAFSF